MLTCVFIAAHGLSLVAGLGFPAAAAFLLQSTESRPVGFRSCGSWAEMLLGMWNLPGPVTGLLSLALADRLLAIGLSGKSSPFPLVACGVGVTSRRPLLCSRSQRFPFLKALRWCCCWLKIHSLGSKGFFFFFFSVIWWSRSADLFGWPTNQVRCCLNQTGVFLSLSGLSHRVAGRDGGKWWSAFSSC